MYTFSSIFINGLEPVEGKADTRQQCKVSLQKEHGKLTFEKFKILSSHGVTTVAYRVFSSIGCEIGYLWVSTY